MANAKFIIDEKVVNRLKPGTLLFWSRYLGQLTCLETRIPDETALIVTSLHTGRVDSKELPGLLLVIAGSKECEVREVYNGGAVSMYQLYAEARG